VSANDPAEELVRVQEGDDFGWPYCYYSNEAHKKVLAPEYGGDGRTVGRCAKAKDPVIAFPGHWAPLALAFVTGNALGAKYDGGLFIAFHGSWNRAPLPQAGYRVVFAPLVDGRSTGAYETFVTGAGGPTSLRASGVAMAKDGAVYISADNEEKIWRVARR
jgi:glucose/arabinose dehydrogenase